MGLNGEAVVAGGGDEVVVVVVVAVVTRSVVSNAAVRSASFVSDVLLVFCISGGAEVKWLHTGVYVVFLRVFADIAFVEGGRVLRYPVGHVQYVCGCESDDG